MLTILTWFWRQPNARFEYTPEHVNAWAKAVRSNVSLPVRIACVTDEPEGIEDWIEIIEPPEIIDVQNSQWSASQGLPQCYRRVAMFAPHAAQVFGERFLCMDLDCLIVGNLDHILERAEDFVMLRGTSATRPYNGSMVLMDAGVRPQVYTEFSEANARIASQKYLGSDQAWISYCLGRGEATFNEHDGIYCYTPRTVRDCNLSYRPPENMAIMFYPGPTKVLHGGKSKGATSKDLLIAELCLMQNTRLLALDDPKGWGKEFARVNRDAQLITDAGEIQEGDKVFVRLDQQGEQLEISTAFALAADAKGAEILPSREDVLLYDDKLAQHEVLKDWLPRTKICKSRKAAENHLKRLSDADYPFISKSHFGASSSAVRLIESEGDARQEIDQAFGEGMTCTYGKLQKGYVYWQELVPDNPCDYRVVVTGGYLFGLVRNNREDVPFASGSGDFYPITLGEDHRERLAMEKAVDIAHSIGTKWTAFDFVFDEDDEPKVLEMSGAWAAHSYADAPMFDWDLNSTQMVGKDMFKVAGHLLRGVAPEVDSNVVVFRKLDGTKKVSAERGTPKFQRLHNSKLWETDA